MATISICVFPVPSVVMGAVAFAKRLRGRGHRVWIISTPDIELAVRAEGLDFAPVLSGLFPSGSFAAELRRFSALTRLARLRELRRAARAYRAIMDTLLEPGGNEIDRAFDRISPDLCLFYSDIPNLVVAALVALRRGLRCAYLTPVFSSDYSLESPPLVFGLVPRPGRWGRFVVWTAWVEFRVRKGMARLLGLATGCDVHLGRYLRRLAAGGEGAGLPARWDCFPSPKLSLPEFFLAPRELEFDFRPGQGSHWLGWCFDEAREEESSALDILDPGRPLVYCSLGTQPLVFASAPRRRAFFQAVVDAMAARPDLQLAIATGGDLGGEPLDLSKSDAIVRERLPQLLMLGRARMMITHCGLHSLMECTSHGVPMVAFPLGFDQPGNSARVLYHGLGLRGDFRRTDSESVGRLIDAVMADDAMTGRCAAMAELARDRRPYEIEIRALESLAGEAGK